MKKKLQVQNPDGSWLWVAMVKQDSPCPSTTTSKAKAMPVVTYWCCNSLEMMLNRFPGYVFRLSESR